MTTYSENEMAESYCKMICDEMEVLEGLLRGTSLVEISDEEGPADLFTQEDPGEMLLELAEGAGENISTYVPSVIDYVNLNCLEVVLLGRRPWNGGEWEATGVELVRTVGGPNAYVIVEDQGLRVEVYWGSQRAQLSPNCPATIRQLAGLFDF